MTNFLTRYSIYFAWLLALSSMLGSLYGSEISHLEVCNLCWYQRILMYPLVIILPIGIYRADPNVSTYALPFSLIGFGVAVYHFLIQKIPNFSPVQVCGSGPSCTDIEFQLFGFMTFAFMAMIAFATISVLLFASKKARVAK